MAHRDKSKYKIFHKNRNTHKLEPGFTGFLCTCSSKFRERECIREAYNILIEFADKLFEHQDNQNDGKPSEVPCDIVSKIDIEESLTKEIEAMKEEKNKNLRRFHAVDSGANGVVFIKTTVPDPVKLAHTIVSTFSKSGQKSKFLLRLLPVEMTCKAYLDEIIQGVEPLLQKYFSAEAKSFAVVYNHRNNDSLNRDEIIEAVASLALKTNTNHKIDLKTPQLVILIEVIRRICCVSVIPDYYSLKKYNILEVALKSESSEVPSVQNETRDAE